MFSNFLFCSFSIQLDLALHSLTCCVFLFPKPLRCQKLVFSQIHRCYRYLNASWYYSIVCQYCHRFLIAFQKKTPWIIMAQHHRLLSCPCCSLALTKRERTHNGFLSASIYLFLLLRASLLFPDHHIDIHDSAPVSSSDWLSGRLIDTQIHTTYTHRYHLSLIIQ